MSANTARKVYVPEKIQSETSAPSEHPVKTRLARFFRVLFFMSAAAAAGIIPAAESATVVAMGKSCCLRFAGTKVCAACSCAVRACPRGRLVWCGAHREWKRMPAP